MLPQSLTAEQFRGYPTQARELAMAHLPLLRQLPLSFLPSLLQELIEYDYKFPAERASLDSELASLERLSPAQRGSLFSDFSRLKVSVDQEKLDWVNQPLAFTEQYSAYLWSTHQMDAFQAAAATYGDRLRAASPPQTPAIPRLGIAVIGAGVTTHAGPLFAGLRPHGTYFSNLEPAHGLDKLLSAVRSRAEEHPAPYAHWYVEGGEPAISSPALTCVSYAALSPVRSRLLSEMQRESSKPGAGPESLRNYMAQLQPERLGLNGNQVLDRFQMKLLTEGSGTQVFSTTFAQWTGREVLRRASALTLLVRFAPRQRQRPMNELLSNQQKEIELDPAGSLIDADMAAYYQWINQQRLPGREQGVFLAWFEGHRQAVAIGPAMPRGVESRSPLDLSAVLTLAAGGTLGSA